MAKQKEMLEMFKKLSGKAIIKAPVLSIPKRGYCGAKVWEYYR